MTLGYLTWEPHVVGRGNRATDLEDVLVDLEVRGLLYLSVLLETHAAMGEAIADHLHVRILPDYTQSRRPTISRSSHTKSLKMPPLLYLA